MLQVSKWLAELQADERRELKMMAVGMVIVGAAALIAMAVAVTMDLDEHAEKMGAGHSRVGYLPGNRGTDDNVVG